MAAPGSVKVAASVLFPAAPKHLTLSFSLNLGVFEWPMNGSNMSGYLSVPRDLAVVVYRKLEDGQEAPISWEEQKKIIHKVHLQSGHHTKKKMIGLLRSSSINWDQKKMMAELDSMIKGCEGCILKKRSPCKP